MNTIPETIRERLLKIKALYERGATEHERATASHQLEKLLKKHGLKLDDLQQTPSFKKYRFHFRNEWEKSLLNQLAGYVSGWRTGGVYWKEGKKRTSILIELAPTEYADLIMLYDYYRKAWATDLKNFFGAWLEAQGLARPVSAKPDTPELSAEAIAKLLLRYQLKQAIVRLPAPLKQLEAGH